MTVCLPTTECPVYQCVPSTSISGRFVGRLLTLLPPFPNLLLLSCWSSRHGVWTLYTCSLVFGCQSAVSFNALLRMSFHVVGPRTNVCTNFLRCRQLFQCLLQRVAILTFFCIRQPYFRLVYIRVECIPSIRDQEMMSVPLQINVFHQFLPHRFGAGFLPAMFMSSTKTDNGPC